MSACPSCACAGSLQVQASSGSGNSSRAGNGSNGAAGPPFKVGGGRAMRACREPDTVERMWEVMAGRQGTARHGTERQGRAGQGRAGQQAYQEKGQDSWQGGWWGSRQGSRQRRAAGRAAGTAAGTAAGGLHCIWHTSKPAAEQLRPHSTTLPACLPSYYCPLQVPGELLRVCLEEARRSAPAAREAEARRQGLKSAQSWAFMTLCSLAVQLSLFAMVFNLAEASGMGIVLKAVAYCLVAVLYCLLLGVAGIVLKNVIRSMANMIVAVQDYLQARRDMRG